jgi:hypothetical protein
LLLNITQALAKTPSVLQVFVGTDLLEVRGPVHLKRVTQAGRRRRPPQGNKLPKVHPLLFFCFVLNSVIAKEVVVDHLGVLPTYVLDEFAEIVKERVGGRAFDQTAGLHIRLHRGAGKIRGSNEGG